MDVSVSLRTRSRSGDADAEAGPRSRMLTVSTNPAEDTVEDVLNKISSQSGVSLGRLQILLGGRRLHGTTPIQQLQLGPATSLLALVVEETATIGPESIKEEDTVAERAPMFTSFFVHCKTCGGGARTAKLRVRCSNCDSANVQVLREPSKWSDVLKSGLIPLECYDCGQTATHARFVFKCSGCSEPAAALQHVRLPRPGNVCCICLNDAPGASSASPSGPIFDLRCGHVLCMDCFTDLVRSGLKSKQFALNPRFGYTILCPWPSCKSVVRDPHHFALAGRETYSEYKAQALDAFVEEDAVHCAHCSVAFIWDPPDQGMTSESNGHGEEENGAPMIVCPHCSKEFCADCRKEPCTCGDEEAANAQTLEATTRACPCCGTRTERSGGCAHMRCPSCSADWCFVCVGPWTDECQWNHWFS